MRSSIRLAGYAALLGAVFTGSFALAAAVVPPEVPQRWHEQAPHPGGHQGPAGHPSEGGNP